MSRQSKRTNEVIDRGHLSIRSRTNASSIHHDYYRGTDPRNQVLGVEMFRETAGDEADEHMASLMGHFGQTTNSLSLLMSLFGTSLCVRLLGLRKTLRIFPTLLVVAVVTSFFAPSLSFLFVAVAILKVCTV